MFGSSARGANAYRTVGVETGVTAASPHKLIVMLFEGAITAISAAMAAMQSGDITKKGASISKAIMIIDSGLRTSLDKSKGGDLAQNLDNLYIYCSNRLLIGNLQNDVQLLEEIKVLLTDIKSAWDDIGRTSPPVVPAAFADNSIAQRAERSVSA